MDGAVNRSNGVSAGDLSGTGSVRRLGSLFADMGGNSGSTGCVNSEWPALAGVKGIFAEDNYPKRKRIYLLGDAIADCCKSRMAG